MLELGTDNCNRFAVLFSSSLFHSQYSYFSFTIYVWIYYNLSLLSNLIDDVKWFMMIVSCFQTCLESKHCWLAYYLLLTMLRSVIRFLWLFSLADCKVCLIRLVPQKKNSPQNMDSFSFMRAQVSTLRNSINWIKLSSAFYSSINCFHFQSLLSFIMFELFINKIIIYSSYNVVYHSPFTV